MNPIRAAHLDVRGLVKLFGKERAVDGVSFHVPQGAFVTLLGPSGCGKTTTLMCIAGLHRLDAGEIRVGDVAYSSAAENVFLEPDKRDIGMVFQSYAIWPHMTVAQNVAYPLEVRKVDRAEIADRVEEVLRVVGLGAMSGKLASQLSGGQQQRAALARAIVFRPRLLLFDEPLSNLDAKLREQMRLELKRIQQEVGITSVYVTHDQSEALVMSDEIIVMSKGRIEQRGSPRDIYARPLSSYVSDFIGSANLVEGHMSRILGPDEGEFETRENVRLRCRPSPGLVEGDRAILSVRPEDVEAVREAGESRIEGEVIQRIFLGNSVEYRVRSHDFEWKVLVHPRADLRTGERVFLRLDPRRTIAVSP